MLLIWFSVLLVAGSHTACAKPECTKLMHELGVTQSQLLLCSTYHAAPVQLCQLCERQYNDLHDAYNAFTNATLNCTKIYFDQDRLNIILTTQTFLTGLWSKAYCGNCNQGSYSADFIQETDDFDDCIQDKQDVCVRCASNYQELNRCYMAMYKNTNGKLCFDFQDSMNRTRKQWSADFKCCTADFKALYFIVAVCCVAILPGLFYGSVFVLTTRRERNHGLLNSDADFVHSAMPSSTTAILPTEPQEASHPKKFLNPFEIPVDSDDDDSSLDEITTHKPVDYRKN